MTVRLLRTRLSLVLVLLLTMSVAWIALPAAPAVAATRSSAPPSADQLPSAAPSAITPNVDDGEVWGVAEVGDLMVIGGNFTSVGGQARGGLAAFNSTTGALTSFAPAIAGGQIYSLFTGPTPNTVYAAGDFTSVNGGGQKYLALLDTTTGQAVSGFTAPTFDFGGIRDITKVGNRLFAGGFFSMADDQTRQGLASMNATTGALDSYLNVQLAGHHNDTGSGAQGYIGPWAIDSSPDGSKLVVTGNFKSADGLAPRPVGGHRPERRQRGGRPQLGDEPILARTATTGPSTATPAASRSPPTAPTSWSIRPVVASPERFATL